MSVQSTVQTNLTITKLTDSSGGSAGNTIVDVPGTYDEATLADQLASLTAKLNKVIDAVHEIRDRGVFN